MKHFPIVMLLLVLGGQPAQASMTVLPMTIDEMVAPGTAAQFMVNVRNNGPRAIGVRCAEGDRLYDEQGQSMMVLPGQNPRSCLAWVDYPKGILDVAAGAVAAIPLQVTVPADASGTYWCNIYVEEDQPSQDISQQPGMHVLVKWRAQVSLNISASATGTRAVEITDMRIVETPGREPSVELAVSNTGDQKVMCRGFIELRDEGGNTLERLRPTTAGQFSLYPGHTRRVLSEPLQHKLGAGVYPVVCLLEFGGAEQIAGQIVYNVRDGDGR